MRISITEIIRIASNFSILIPFIFYVIKIKYSSKAIHAIGSLVILSGIADLIGAIFFSQHRSTAIVSNIFIILQFSLLSWIFLELILIRKLKTIVFIGIAIYIVSLITVTTSYQGFLQNQTLMWTISGVIIIVFSAIFCLYLLSGLPTFNILAYPPAWINAGIFFYFTFSLYLFVISDFLFFKVEKEVAVLIWSFHNMNNIIKNILFAIGLSLIQKRKS